MLYFHTDGWKSSDMIYLGLQKIASDLIPDKQIKKRTGFLNVEGG